MADRRISQLVEATAITSSDLFVTEQDSQTKKVTGQTFINSLATALSGKGGISSITKTSTSGLVDTYTITYANLTTSTFTVTNGSQGATGANAYVHIRYSTNEPTQDSDMHTWADRWMGSVSTNSATAPTTYTSYQWYDTKGAKGDTGDDGVSPTLASSSVEYADSDSGDVAPTEGWTTEVPTVQEGHFLWTRIIIEFSTGDPIIAYSVGKIGTSGSGSGSVTSVGVQNTTGGDLTVSGSPITSSGTITIGHSNATITAQTTQAVYPIKFDSKGHITAYGTAATASTIGAIANPQSKTQGQVLTYDGSTWVAQNPSGAVSSVNGYTGAVVLDAEAVGAIEEPSGATSGQVLTYDGSDWVAQTPSVSVTSVNGMTGSVTTSKALTASLDTSGWTQSGSLYVKSVTVSGVTSTATLIVTTAPASYDVWVTAKIRATAQATDSVTFSAASVPTATVTANILMVNAV